jgi:hypothetical protein
MRDRKVLCVLHTSTTPGPEAFPPLRLCCKPDGINCIMYLLLRTPILMY